MIHYQVSLETKNPNNGARGNSRLAAIIRSNKRKEERTLLRLITEANVKQVSFPVTVEITRVAPSKHGLDPHDGLGAALKGCIDGIADGLGLTNDRDPRVEWKLSQRRGHWKQYAIEVTVREQAGIG